MRLDPSRTTMLRRRFEADLYKRFRKLKGAIRELVVKEDAFGLRPTRNAVPQSLGSLTFGPQTPPPELMTNERWRFMTDAEKLEKFDEWLQKQVNRGSIQLHNRPTDRYVRDGYHQGNRRAFEGVREETSIFDEKKLDEKTVRLMFTDIDRLRSLQSRTFTELEGVTNAMAAQMKRVLSDGLIRGDRPERIAQLLNNRVDKIGITRARMIARTEIIRANAEGALDAMERLGISEVRVNVEWTTAEDPCPLCQPLKGVVLRIDQARGLFPRHPNCRCSPVPSDARAYKERIRKAVRRSVEAAKGSGSWEGPDLTKRRSRRKKRRPAFFAQNPRKRRTKKGSRK